MIGKTQTVADNKYVTFLLAGREYATDIKQIVEIIYFQKSTPMPEAHGFVEGVVDLRGKVIPVIDLKKILVIQASENTVPNHILIIRFHEKKMGIVVDEVREVLQISNTRIQSPQEVLEGKVSRHLKGVSKMGDRMIFILSLENMLSLENSRELEGGNEIVI